jgi:hypothetical protein
MSDDPIINLFLVAVILWVFFLLLGAIVKSSPKRNLYLAELKAKEAKTKEELRINGIQRAHCLNKMFQSGSITHLEYTLGMDNIIQDFKQFNMDPYIIHTIILRPESGGIYGKKNVDKIMTTANELRNRGELTDEEHEDYINKALDQRKNFK